MSLEIELTINHTNLNINNIIFLIILFLKLYNILLYE